MVTLDSPHSSENTCSHFVVFRLNQITSTKADYGINFTRYFSLLQPFRTLEETHADIHLLERETNGLLEEIIGEKQKDDIDRVP